MALTIEKVKITPKIATEWLEKYNTGNRPVRPELVDRLNRDILAGNWHETGDTIKFAKDGSLSDGQHRLSAIIKSKKPLTLHVVRGLDPEAKLVIDTGAVRSARDSLLLSGMEFKNSAIVVSIARLMLSDPRFGYVTEAHRKRSASTSEIRDFLSDHMEDIQTGAELAAKYYRDIGIAPSVLGGFWMAVSHGNGDKAHEFLVSLAERRTDGFGDPRLALLRRLGEFSRERTRLPQKVYLSLLMRTWNSWITGKRVEKLQLTNKKGSFVEMPEPILVAEDNSAEEDAPAVAAS